jgi:hypothetical protein
MKSKFNSSEVHADVFSLQNGESLTPGTLHEKMYSYFSKLEDKPIRVNKSSSNHMEIEIQRNNSISLPENIPPMEVSCVVNAIRQPIYLLGRYVNTNQLYQLLLLITSYHINIAN